MRVSGANLRRYRVDRFKSGADTQMLGTNSRVDAFDSPNALQEAVTLCGGCRATHSGTSIAGIGRLKK